jgi:small subunit ribosomal protein S13
MNHPIIKLSLFKTLNRARLGRAPRPAVGRATLLDINKKLAFTRPLLASGLPRRAIFDKLISVLRRYPRFADQKKVKYDYIQVVHRMQGYRSLRLRSNMPARGQRTHTNAKTRKKRGII